MQDCLLKDNIITLSVFEVKITSLSWSDIDVSYKFVVNKVYKVRTRYKINYGSSI